MFWRAAATGVIGNLVLDIEALVKVSKWVAMSWLVMQAIADIVIATCMCLVLRHRRTGFRNTGLVTSVLSCILLGMVHFDNFHSVIMFSKYGLNVSVLTISLPLGSLTMLAKHIPMIPFVSPHAKDTPGEA
ncbi:hypothetical protein BS47DRAFT_1364808 [Hydnum rufescens UP504]|uniref:Uncharacterized protein n=1 Tax=Hydnum rufescens UP504 TaxID=1448309 RepID=A0A9P6AQP3_9AGAM|nr:hypothetical protein BS47DRAFT_1364808 [Hydnum rufescens UP504]